ncbi:GGDEF domain-containing protein, partial [Candidatus Woesearchaeota archaeon]|nr:GGDEF domain-containing protein [Candidatus Woesearchaeota archaeon]
GTGKSSYKPVKGTLEDKVGPLEIKEMMEEDAMEIPPFGQDKIENLLNKTFSNKNISSRDITFNVQELENPEDRISYLNTISSYKNMGLNYKSKFDNDVPCTISTLIEREILNLRNKIYTDSLTKLPNRAYIDKRNEERRTNSQNNSYCVLMTDIDKFKAWNDKYGHNIGDIALKAVAAIIRASIRKTEGLVGNYKRSYVARYGGEEFYVELDGTSAQNANKVAERIRDNVEQNGMSLISHYLKNELGEKRFNKLKNKLENEKQTMTISIGIAGGDKRDPPEYVRSDADTALYHAKDQGRNRVVLYKPGMTIPN